MRLEYLEEFLSLAETCSFSATADEMFISASALSRHIALLEEEIGEKLFNRDTRVVTLSDAGVRLVPFARQMIATKKEYLGSLDQKNTQPQQELKLGFSSCIVQYGVMDLILEFRRRYPDINVRLEEDTTESLLRKAREKAVSFAFCYSYPFLGVEGLLQTDLIMDELVAALPGTHPMADKKKISLRKLKNEPFVMRKEGGAYSRSVFQLCATANFTPQVIANAESGDYLINLVAHGLGIAIVEKIRFRNFCPPNTVLVDIEPSSRKALSMFSHDEVMSETERLFQRFVRDNASEYTANDAGRKYIV